MVNARTHICACMDILFDYTGNLNINEKWQELRSDKSTTDMRIATGKL